VTNSRVDNPGEHAAIRLLLGGTAVGKSDVALRMAERCGVEIVSIDSMQVYRRMDIGTAKPTEAERARVRHHLIDLFEPWESCTAARFVPLADGAIAEIRGRGRIPLLVAGTPFYLMALLYGLFEGPSADPDFRAAMRERAAAEGSAALHAELAAIDPAAAGKIHRNDLFRIARALEVHHRTGRPISDHQRQWGGPPRYAVRMVGLRRAPQEHAHRINARVRAMFDAGWVDEVRGLIGGEGSAAPGLSTQARQALGYSQILRHLAGELTLEEAIEQTKINTRQFAKSQRTWFRRFPEATWIEVGADETADVTAQCAEEAFRKDDVVRGCR